MSETPPAYHIALIEAVAGLVVERFEGGPGAALDRLDKARLTETDDQFYTFARGSTSAELEAVIPEKIEKGRRVYEARREALAKLPPVLGEPEIDEAAWEALRADYGADAGRLANLAAHSWAILPPDDGFVLVVGHGLYGERWEPGPQRPRTLEPGEVPTICQNCIHTTRYLAVRASARPLRCSIGHTPGAGGVIRPVGRIQTCAGWEACR